MSDQDSDTPAAKAPDQDNGENSSRSEAPNPAPQPPTPSAPSDPPHAADAGADNAADNDRVVIDVTRSPTPTTTPLSNGATQPPQPVLPPNVTPQQQQQQRPQEGHQPYPSPQLYPQRCYQPQPVPQSIQRPLRPIYSSAQAPPPPPPPPPPPQNQNGQPPPPQNSSGQPPSPQSYVVNSQAPLLMDRCPRCQFVPTLPQGQSPPPLPPYGSYLPSNLYPPPNHWPQSPPQRPPPPQSSPPAPLPQSSSASSPSQSVSRCRMQIAPEFRNTKYFPNWGRRPPPPNVQIHYTAAHSKGLPASDVPDYLPDDPNGFVIEPFIPAPRYAPVPSPEAIAFLRPKWPKPPKQPVEIVGEGETRREKQRRVGRQRLTRDQRRDVLLMRRLGYQFESIAKFLGTTISACHYTSQKGTPEVGHKNAGRRVRMPLEIITRMVEYVKDYQKQERAAGKDRKTGKRKMPMLTYNLIRENCFRNENGEIPTELKYTDDALKQLLNKNGLWLRQQMSALRKEEGRRRGIKQWQDKLAKDRAEAQRLAAEATAAGQPVSEELAAIANGTADVGEPPIEDAGSDMEGYGSPGDEEMGDAYSATDDTPSENDDDDDDDSMQIEHQLRQAIAAPENYG